MVGFVTLFGITVRNSIMLISHYEHLVAVEGREWGYRAAIDGASERLIPILMTALVTALGLLPLALGSNAPGQEIEGPLAIVILGGLITSTALNLLVLPTLALRLDGSKSPLRKRPDASVGLKNKSAVALIGGTPWHRGNSRSMLNYGGVRNSAT